MTRTVNLIFSIDTRDRLFVRLFKMFVCSASVKRKTKMRLKEKKKTTKTKKTSAQVSTTVNKADCVEGRQTERAVSLPAVCATAYRPFICTEAAAAADSSKRAGAHSLPAIVRVDYVMTAHFHADHHHRLQQQQQQHLMSDRQSEKAGKQASPKPLC